MMNKIPLVDLVRAFAGSEVNIISAVIDRHGKAHGRPIVVGLEAQRGELGGFVEAVDFRIVPGAYEPQVLSFIADMVRDHLEKDPDAGFVIYSFHPMVFNLQNELTSLAWAI